MSGKKIRNATSVFVFMLKNPKSQETKSQTNPKSKISNGAQYVNGCKTFRSQLRCQDRLIGQAMRCFNAHFIISAMTAVAVKSLAAQTAIPLVDIRSVDPTIVIELRYAGKNNLVGHALYPSGTPALVRPEVATRLVRAQAFLRRYHYQLKIWDAYRPKSVQVHLWQVAHNDDYVADPQVGAGSLHSWGVAVDATLIDAWHRPVPMPTDFDDFTPAAMWHYRGRDPAIRWHVHLLQIAMRDAGFHGLPSEWWHFTIADWQKYLPPEEAAARRAGYSEHPGKAN
jgi:zinc D-Ala-D-Ala dipeptidase